ncbi:non-ribosomal peptide synthetase [Chitinimonas lacunae]|uniref:Amino acid adenylation domain-containing protein n=1 Tax=Chitinimonas lacunae TaxID=1963018 RepID=A0ABV8MPX4_9NEIS
MQSGYKDNKNDIYPLSYAQQSLWFLTEWAPESGAYNMGSIYRIEGELDIPRLRLALDRVMRRHPVLCSIFGETPEGPFQRVIEPVETPFELIETSDELSILELAQWQIERPFDLRHEPAIRAILYRQGSGLHYLVLVQHHLVSDAWSIELIARDLSAAYRGDLPATVARHYGEFAQAEKSPGHERLLAQSRRDWLKRLAGMPTVLELPRQFPRPAVRDFSGNTFSQPMSAELLTRLKQYCVSKRCTLATVLLAAYQSLLCRYTGQTDFGLGMPVAGRMAPGSEETVGMFVNMVVLRATIDPAASFETLLGQTRRAMLLAMDQQDYPFALLARDLVQEQDRSREPLVQNTFNYLKASACPLGLSGTEVERVYRETSYSKFDFSLQFVESDSGVQCFIVYDSRLFAPWFIDRLFSHFRCLLEQAISAPEQRIKDLPLLDKAELAQLVAWNHTALSQLNPQQSIHQLFEAQVAQQPDAVAVVFADRQLSYGELNRQANRLAHRLVDLGVGPDTLVAICVERSLEMVVGLLAILKAGGAYVPLDPDYPAERLAYMLDDTAAPLILTQSWLQARLPAHSARVICLDEPMRDGSDANLAVRLHPDNLAYCIYTSGSTGKPKGAINTHQGFVNLVRWYFSDRVNTTGSERVLLASSLSFDLTQKNLLGTLSFGATVIVPVGATADSDGLREAWQRHRPTRINCAPSAYRAFRAAIPDSSIRTVVLGGEPIEPGLVAQLAARGITLVNSYGPTECADVAISHLADPAAGSVPLGKPVPNVRIHILDASLNRVPVGVTGEIYIAGVGLARGYLNRPDLTAEKFLPSPFDGPGSRMYRTGDLGYYLPNGEIEFLGRTDHQVKIRGFRIELSEVDNALQGCEGVREAVVMVDRSQQQLVAYVVGTAVDAEALRQALRQSLPDHMVPSGWVFLDAFPLNPNGKIDRKALATLALTEAHSGTEYVAPRTEAEALLATIWAGVLQCERVGLHDNFFALGGHSLLATQVVTRIRQAFQVELPLRVFFAAQNLAELAQQIASAQGLEQQPIAVAPREGDLPCSFAQQRLWFLEQYEPDSSLYNLPAVWRLKGALDHPALTQSLNDLLARHEVLRTHFVQAGESAVQQIADVLTLNPTLIDLSDQPDAEAEALRQLRAEAARPFDLGQAPLLRAHLVKLDAATHLLLLTMHHIVSDGWSMGVLKRELSALYQARLSGMPADLPPLPIQYADFARWQRHWLQGAVLARQVDYWKHRLAGAPAVLALPTDHPRPASRTTEGASVPFELSAELSARLRQLSQQAQATPFMTLAAVFNVLLHRYSQQDDLCIGYPVANRQRAEVEGLIGFFVNTLVLRTRLSPEQRFIDLLQQVRESVLDADAHQDVPFEKLVEELQPERSLSYTPLFQVMLTLNNTGEEALTLAEVTAEPVRLGTGSAKFDLMLGLAEHSGQLAGALSYSTALFEAATIERMIGHFRTLLEAVVAAPQRRIKELPLLSEAELAQRLAWNHTALAYPNPQQSIHQLFEAQVAQQPDAVAVVFADRQLSYGELNRQANRLAHRLVDLGVGPDTLVAICVERSLEMVVGLLAILKAGGAYVPLDPDYPAERLAYMLDDTAAPLILTQSWLQARLPAHSARVICLDEPMRDGSDANLAVRLHPDNLAYCIYTSGSTGKPKGAINTHQGFVNLVRWYFSDRVNTTGSERVLLASSLSFDLTQKNLLGTLAFGATVIVPVGATADSDGLREAWQRHRPTRINCAPSAYRAFRAAIPDSSIRTVVLGGEPIEPGLVAQLAARGITLVNSYGPTECADVAISHLADPAAGSVPLGKPVPNVRIHILDASLNRVPVGVTGEIYIAGVGLARGYLNRPDLTAEKFLPSPFDGPGSRMYRTGDLGYYLPNGEIEFLGRTDHQVKIRGFRIELSEVDNALQGCEGVREAVVMVEPTQQRLVAYVVGKTEAAVDAEALRQALRQSLPDHMVPSGWVFLDAFPLNPNGKIDRKLLTGMTPLQADSGLAYLAPRTEVETLLAAIWAEVLQCERIGLHDNFFVLGGHSLLATQVMARIRQTFQIELPLRVFFTVSNLAELAQQISEAQGAQSQVIAIVPRDQPLPASFAQQRLWFLEQYEPGSPLYNLSAAWRLDGVVDYWALTQSLNDLLARHEALRTYFVPGDGMPLQQIAGSLTLSPVLVDLSGQPDAETEALHQLGLAAAQPFDPAQAPLLRVHLFKLSQTTHLLLLTMHHIVSDGWSMGVIKREWSELYRARCAGQPAVLPPLPIQYADFALWQRQRLQGTLLAKRLDYWKRQLAGAPAVLALPTDRPRPAIRSHQGAAVPFELGTELSAQLHQLSRQCQSTLFMTLAAAFNVLLHRYSQQDDICIGYAVANRQRAEIEELVGFFVNTLVLRTRLQPEWHFIDLLERVRESVLDADAHQELPFEKLVEELQPERNPGHTPLFQVMLTLNNTAEAPLALGEVKAEPLRVGSHRAKFDLTLGLVEHEGQLIGSLSYSTALFDAATIERMVGHFRTVLAAVVADPTTPLKDLPLLSKTEVEQLAAWNDTTVAYPAERCIHELFEDQVRANPEAVALLIGEQQLSYGELNRRANQLAHHLVAQGVGRDTLVGLCVERSLDMVVGLLAILKAGGAYLPLDPDYPAERLAYMVEDTGAALILTQAKLRACLPAQAARLLCLDEPDRWAVHPFDDLPGRVRSRDLAYCLFTSGSTGRPKATLIEHRSVVRLVRNVDYARLDASQVFLQAAPLAFDASTLELWGSLLNGARLAILPPGKASFDELAQAIERHEVSILWLTAALFEQFSRTHLSALRSVRQLLAGGDVLAAGAIRRVLDGLPHCTLINGYGPTESTTFAACYRFPPDFAGASAPIGRPIANTRIYLLDRHRQPVPQGVVGEIHIGGDGLARGYLNRPELTAERFITTPYGRLYRSGDLGRYLPDGNIEFLGRLDHQVKIRGFRIEPGEVEAALRACPAVAEALVVPHEDDGDKRLVAYLIAADGQLLDTAELRRRLALSLADHMLPSAFVVLPAFPLTPNGKLDRRALPAPDRTALIHSEFAAPEGEVEQTIAALWQELLRLERVGRHDHFFALGGHSLLAAQLAGRLRERLGVNLSLRELFELPVLSQLAARLTELQLQQFSTDELAALEQELAGLSEEALRALLEGASIEQ